MAARKVKSPAKMFTSNQKALRDIIMKTATRVEGIVGSSLGPGGKISIIESDLPGIPNTSTKDGVTIFRNLGANDPFEHLIIEQWRDVAVRTVNEAGDGPQPLHSKVLTPTGFIEMRDVETGMEVCGVNDTVQNVLGVFPKGKKEIYEIEFFDGRVVECCSDHLWTVNTSYGVKKTLTTGEMAKNFVKTDENGQIRYRYYCQNTSVNFSENTAEMPLDPYLVGLLLGDGSLSGTGSIELSLGVSKEHILNKIKLPEGMVINSSFVESKNYYRVKISGLSNGRTAHRIIESLGLLGTCSDSKFIPKSYLYASKKSRLALLQGLIDTDGHVNVRGRFEYSTVSNELKDDFISLVRSLGISINHSIHDRTNDPGSYSNKSIHRIVELKGFKHGTKITDIRATGRSVEMQCIKVSNDNHLYITDNYIPTHNTTSATVLSAALIKGLFTFCEKYPKYSPQKGARTLQKLLDHELIPLIDKKSIKINNKNKNLLKLVAQVSSNGDEDMAEAVMKAFEVVGYGASSHVTIQQLSGPTGFNIDLVEGFPIAKGYEESIGKFHPAFINDQSKQRCVLDKPLFILFDGGIKDLVQFGNTLTRIGDEYVNGNTDFTNVVIVAHAFSDKVLTSLAYNFQNPDTINIVPLRTPIDALINSQLNFLLDLSAFTGAKIFDMSSPIADAIQDDFGQGMDKIEIYRFRTTISGDPDSVNIETRASEISTRIKQAESKLEKTLLEEKLGKLTSGIAKLQIFGSSDGDLKEMADRAEDAVCAVRAAIGHGCLPGGCRMLIDLAVHLQMKEESDLNTKKLIDEVLVPSLLTPFYRLLSNSGYNDEETEDIMKKLIKNDKKVFNAETGEFGDFKKLGIFDATLAVKQALVNAISISKILGTMGGIIAYPRDHQLERNKAIDDMDFKYTVENAKNPIG